jgi:hypothetical protein
MAAEKVQESDAIIRRSTYESATQYRIKEVENKEVKRPEEGRTVTQLHRQRSDGPPGQHA